jgi:hypothetical protein
MRLTNAGKNVLLKAQMGSALKFKRVGVGAGTLLEDTDIKKLTALIDEKMKVDIASYELDEEKNIMTMKININNRELKEGFFMRELGVFVEDPDDSNKEVLYSIVNTGNEGDFLPRAGNIPVEIILEIFAVVGEAEHIEVIINDTLIYVLRSEYEDDIKELNERIKVLQETSSEAIKEIKTAVGDDPNFASNVSEEVTTIAENIGNLSKNQDDIKKEIGDLKILKTQDKSNVVDAINEVIDKVEDGVDYDSEFEKLELTLKEEMAVSRTSVRAAGTVNAMSIDASFDLTVPDNVLNVTPANTNTGATTISINGAIKSIKKFDIDENSFIELEKEDIKKNTPLQLTWNKELNFFVYAPKGARIEEIQFQNAVYQTSMMEDIKSRKETLFEVQSIECNDKYIIGCTKYVFNTQSTITVLDSKSMNIHHSFKTSYAVKRQNEYCNNEMAIVLDDDNSIYTIEANANDSGNFYVVKYDIMGNKIWEKKYIGLTYPSKTTHKISQLQGIHKVKRQVMITAMAIPNDSLLYWYIDKNNGNIIMSADYITGYAGGSMLVFPTVSDIDQMYIGGHVNLRWVRQVNLATYSQKNDNYATSSRFKINSNLFEYIRIPHSSNNSLITLKPRATSNDVYINIASGTNNGYMYSDNIYIAVNPDQGRMYIIKDIINYSNIAINIYGTLITTPRFVRPRMNKYGIVIVGTDYAGNKGLGIKRFAYKRKINN